MLHSVEKTFYGNVFKIKFKNKTQSHNLRIFLSTFVVKLAVEDFDLTLSLQPFSTHGFWPSRFSVSRTELEKLYFQFWKVCTGHISVAFFSPASHDTLRGTFTHLFAISLSKVTPLSKAESTAG